MECPRPQPGHQVMPIILNGHNEKWDCSVGLVSANETMAATQKANSKYFLKAVLINFIGFGGQQYRYAQ